MFGKDGYRFWLMGKKFKPVSRLYARLHLIFTAWGGIYLNFFRRPPLGVAVMSAWLMVLTLWPLVAGTQSGYSAPVVVIATAFMFFLAWICFPAFVYLVDMERNPGAARRRMGYELGEDV